SPRSAPPPADSSAPISPGISADADRCAARSAAGAARTGGGGRGDGAAARRGVAWRGIEPADLVARGPGAADNARPRAAERGGAPGRVLRHVRRRSVRGVHEDAGP